MTSVSRSVPSIDRISISLETTRFPALWFFLSAFKRGFVGLPLAFLFGLDGGSFVEGMAGCWGWGLSSIISKHIHIHA